MCLQLIEKLYQILNLTYFCINKLINQYINKFNYDIRK